MGGLALPLSDEDSKKISFYLPYSDDPSEKEGLLSMTDKAVEAGYAKPVPAVIVGDTTATATTTGTHLGAGQRTPYITRLRTRWAFLAKRTRIAIYTTLAVLVLLIIGLAVGITLKNKQDDSSSADLVNGGFHGQLTYFTPGVGACGFTNGPGDNIVAVSHILFDRAQQGHGSNPNANPLCGRRVRVQREGKSVELRVVDRCTGCAERDLDTTTSVFKKLAKIDEGRVEMQWNWADGRNDEGN